MKEIEVEKYCDNKSVGVVLRDDAGELALLTRGRFPVGVAPPAGHIDTHGSPERAAVEEVGEELGVTLAIGGLQQTVIRNRRVDNVCRRIGGGYHIWTVYEAQVARTDLLPDPDETNGARWCAQSEVQALADRTRAYRQGEVSERSWSVQPGLEPVWYDFFDELGYLQ